MKEKTGNPNFVYEIACDQMCGKGHTGMRGEIEVITQSEYDMWMLSRKSQYLVANPDQDPAAPKPATTDSLKIAAATTQPK